eukprot:TRINITY_DN42_c7_g1_i1.p1 TRINITY_DN42_c7_g1~~TRINITY_DN42_c7_g1_i1.p1  ORF type:complete len:565 (+),score=222.72 TRINITY_DN42_c7_g1_i1:29-1696(+)
MTASSLLDRSPMLQPAAGQPPGGTGLPVAVPLARTAEAGRQQHADPAAVQLSVPEGLIAADRPRPRCPPVLPPSDTPWYPHGVPAEGTSLARELWEFDKLLALDQQELAERTQMVARVQEIARRSWPRAVARAYGSLAYGLSLTTSSVDVVVENCSADPAAAADPVAAFAGAAERAGFGVVSKWHSPTESYAGLTCAGVSLSVSFIQGTSRAMDVVRTVESLVRRYPSVRPAFAVLRTLLRQSKCNDALDGGLSSYALLLMLLQEAGRVPPPGRADRLLLDFFKSFGGDGPMPAVCGHGPLPAGWDGRQLWIADPLDEASNVAASCTKLPRIRALFRHCSMSLERWDCMGCGQLRGGRTALSSIVAMQHLWPVAHAKRERQQSQAAAAAKPPLAAPAPPPPPPPAMQPQPAAQLRPAAMQQVPPQPMRPLQRAPLELYTAPPIDAAGLGPGTPLAAAEQTCSTPPTLVPTNMSFSGSDMPPALQSVSLEGSSRMAASASLHTSSGHSQGRGSASYQLSSSVLGSSGGSDPRPFAGRVFAPTPPPPPPATFQPFEP